ncbi:MAG: hypothetical protein L3J47_07275 [Sulfurovum sp.]|nr:hypothetical protein [Sulfurovum sp.]
MNILLINTNPVVSRLVSLCMRDESIVFEEAEHMSDVKKSAYDIVFVDDASYNDSVVAFSTWVADIGTFVLLSSRDGGDETEDKFDVVIKKPFLPSQIQAVIDRVKTQMPLAKAAEESASVETDGQAQDMPESEDEADITEEVSVEEEHFIFPLSSDNDVDDAGKEEVFEPEETPEIPKVLDSNEIEQIKVLLDENEEEDLPSIDLEDEEELEARKVEVITQKLEEDGLEIVEEDEIIEAISTAPKAKKKKRKAKKMKKKREEVYTFEEALLAAVENMKPKKIKKLLKGAEVTIKIRFKDEA